MWPAAAARLVRWSQGSLIDHDPEAHLSRVHRPGHTPAATVTTIAAAMAPFTSTANADVPAAVAAAAMAAFTSTANADVPAADAAAMLPFTPTANAHLPTAVTATTARAAAARALLAVACIAALGSCAPAPVGAPVPDRGVPGFDTRDYPGESAMRAWREASPYRWVGYYLPAPCYTGTGWTGQRATLHDMGWGLAVLFVGEQDWSAMRAAGDTAAIVAGERCAVENLTAARAAEHAAAAEAAAQADGFRNGTVIYLDVERVENVSVALADYVRAWTGALLDGGRYVPGLYAHDANTPSLITILTEEFLRRQRVERPPLWVAKQSGFDVRRSPVESGYPIATAWQGIFNTRESWGGVEMLIDVNVADSEDPSRSR